jgi:bifunctional enzyme CysN/CysC
VIGPDRFVEVFLDAPLDICRSRDTTGAYHLADTGRLTDFPGVSAAYDPPTQADLTLHTHGLSVEQSVDQILELLKERTLIS